MKWAAPSSTVAGKLRKSIMKRIWGRGSKMRCMEVVIGISKDPTRLDLTFAAALRTKIDTRRMRRKSEDRLAQAAGILHQ